MILETQEEKDAFEFVCKLADMATDRGCNDLVWGDRKKFKNLKIERWHTDGTKEITRALYDFDILHWLKEQVK